MRWMCLSLLAMTLTLPTARAAHAEDPATGARETAGAQRGEQHDMRRKAMRRKIEVIRIARLTDELDLDVETAVRVVPLFKRFDKLERNHRHARRQAYDELRHLVDGEPVDEAAVSALLNRYFDSEEAHVKQRRELFKDLGGVLSVEQQARFVLFLPRFQKEMRTIARDLARGRRGDRGDDRRMRDRPPHHGDRRPGGEPGRPPEDWLAEPEMDR